VSLAIYPALFKHALATRNEPEFARLLERYRDNQAFLRASSRLLVAALDARFEAAVQALHPLVPDLTEALHAAAVQQRADLVDLFLVSGRLDTRRALFLLTRAGAGGHALARLLPFRRLDLEMIPDADKSPDQVLKEECCEALFAAAEAGNREAVMVLARETDPEDYRSHPLQVAARQGHLSVIEALAPMSDVLVALMVLAREGEDAAAARLAPYVPESVLMGLENHSEWPLLARVPALTTRLQARAFDAVLPPPAVAVHARLL